MRVGKSEWLGVAEAAAKELEGKSGGVRRTLLATMHLEGGPAPQNLRRMVKAYLYVAAQAKNAGLALNHVKASYEAVETIMRIAGIDPSEAARLLSGVLTGEVTGREIRAVLRSVRLRRETSRVVDADSWRVYWQETVPMLFFGRCGPLSAHHQSHSARGRWLGVDLEVELLNGKEAVVFLTPSCRFSSFVRRPLEEQLPCVLASLRFYDEVYLIVHSADERVLAEALLEGSDDDARRIDVRDYLPWDPKLVDP